MFVIADNSQKVPVFLWKVSHGTNFITHQLSEAQKFTTMKAANEFLKNMGLDSTFIFKAHELGIIA